MSQTKNHCEPLVADWLRPSTLEPCICCKQVAEKPRGEHLKMMYVCMYVSARGYESPLLRTMLTSLLFLLRVLVVNEKVIEMVLCVKLLGLN